MKKFLQIILILSVIFATFTIIKVLNIIYVNPEIKIASNANLLDINMDQSVSETKLNFIKEAIIVMLPFTIISFLFYKGYKKEKDTKFKIIAFVIFIITIIIIYIMSGAYSELLFNIGYNKFSSYLYGFLITMAFFFFSLFLGNIMRVILREESGVTLIEILISMSIFGCLIWYFIMDSTGYRSYTRAVRRKQACYSNLRIINSAVEMYNMDFEADKKMSDLNLDILVKNRYLKSKLECPENKESYQNIGNLSMNGIISCGNDPNASAKDYDKYHGSIDGSK